MSMTRDKAIAKLKTMRSDREFICKGDRLLAPVFAREEIAVLDFALRAFAEAEAAHDFESIVNQYVCCNASRAELAAALDRYHAAVALAPKGATHVDDAG